MFERAQLQRIGLEQRPICARCNRPVQSVKLCEENYSDRLTYLVECHGAAQLVSIDRQDLQDAKGLAEIGSVFSSWGSILAALLNSENHLCPVCGGRPKLELAVCDAGILPDEWEGRIKVRCHGSVVELSFVIGDGDSFPKTLKWFKSAVEERLREDANELIEEQNLFSLNSSRHILEIFPLLEENPYVQETSQDLPATSASTWLSERQKARLEVRQEARLEVPDCREEAQVLIDNERKILFEDE